MKDRETLPRFYYKSHFIQWLYTSLFLSIYLYAEDTNVSLYIYYITLSPYWHGDIC